jgi:hypothetical protein
VKFEAGLTLGINTGLCLDALAGGDNASLLIY